MKRISAKSPGKKLRYEVLPQTRAQLPFFPLHNLHPFAGIVTAALRPQVRWSWQCWCFISDNFPEKPELYFIGYFPSVSGSSRKQKMPLIHFCKIAKVACLLFFREIYIFTANKPLIPSNWTQITPHSSETRSFPYRLRIRYPMIEKIHISRIRSQKIHLFFFGKIFPNHIRFPVSRYPNPSRRYIRAETSAVVGSAVPAIATTAVPATPREYSSPLPASVSCSLRKPLR